MFKPGPDSTPRTLPSFCSPIWKFIQRLHIPLASTRIFMFSHVQSPLHYFGTLQPHLGKTSFTGMSIFRFRVELSLELSLRIHLCRKPWPGSMCHLGWQPSRSSASSCQRQGRRANQEECEANAFRQGKSRAMPHRCECSFSNFGLQQDEGGGKTARSLPARIPP